MPTRKSNRRKSIHGTGRADRQPRRDFARRLTRSPPAPADLSPRAAEEWRRLAPAAVDLGTLCAADIRAFSLLCETLAAEAAARDVLQREGFTVQTGAGTAKPHPALRAAETARRDAARLLGCFGLHPLSRQTVDIAPRQSDDDEYFNHPLLGGAARKYLNRK